MKQEDFLKASKIQKEIAEYESRISELYFAKMFLYQNYEAIMAIDIKVQEYRVPIPSKEIIKVSESLTEIYQDKIKGLLKMFDEL